MNVQTTRWSKLAVLSVVVGAMVVGLSPLDVSHGQGIGSSGADPIRVSIAIKPGDVSTTIAPNRDGMIPVVILSTREFDATRVDPTTVRVGAAGTEAAPFRSTLEDIDEDGDTDMLLLIRVRQMGLERGAEWRRFGSSRRRARDRGVRVDHDGRVCIEKPRPDHASEGAERDQLESVGGVSVTSSLSRS